MSCLISFRLVRSFLVCKCLNIVFLFARFIQRFAHHFNVNHPYMADDTIVNFWTTEPVSFLDMHLKIHQIGSERENIPETFGDLFQVYENYQPSSRKVAAYSGPDFTYGIIGIRKFRPSR